MAKQKMRAAIQAIAPFIPQAWHEVDTVIRGAIPANGIRDQDPSRDPVEEEGDLGFTAQYPDGSDMRLMWCLQQKEPEALTWTGIRVILSWGNQVFASCTIDMDIRETRRDIYGPNHASTDDEAPALSTDLAIPSVRSMAECFQGRHSPTWLEERWKE